MKKIIKTLIYTLLFITVVIGTKSISHASYMETPYTSLPKKTKISVKDGGYCMLGVGTANEDIVSVRSKNKNLSARITSVVEDDSTGGKWYKVELYAKKAGIYKFSYVYKRADGSTQNKTVKVKATDESPFKYVKLGKCVLLKDRPNLVKAKQAKLSVKMNSGYRLEKIEVERYQLKYNSERSQDAEFITTTVRNNSKIEISDQPFVWNRIGKNSYTYCKNLIADSYIYIHYVDKFSKEKSIIGFKICKSTI